MSPEPSSPIQILSTEPDANTDIKQEKFTPKDILPGCKVHVSKDGEFRLAEILQEHIKRVVRYSMCITKILTNV